MANIWEYKVVSIGNIRLFPKLRLSKFSKLAKNFDHSPKLWWKLNPGPRIISLMLYQIGHWAFCSTCASNKHQFTSSMYHHASLVLSNWANWVNLSKESWIKGKLHCQCCEFVKTSVVWLVPGYCANGARYYDGACYWLGTTSKSFSEAENHCQERGRGHLATFHSEQDYEFLKKVRGSVITQTNVKKICIWLIPVDCVKCGIRQRTGTGVRNMKSMQLPLAVIFLWIIFTGLGDMAPIGLQPWSAQPCVGNISGSTLYLDHKHLNFTIMLDYLGVYK